MQKISRGDKYEVLRPIYHAEDERDYAPGDVVNLDYLIEVPHVIDSLIERAFVRPVESSAESPPERDSAPPKKKGG